MQRCFFYDRDANFILVGAIYLFSLSRPCRDAGPLVVFSRHCEDSVLLYRVMQGLVPIGTLVYWLFCHGTARTLSSCTVLCKVSSLSGRIVFFYYFAECLFYLLFGN